MAQGKSLTSSPVCACVSGDGRLDKPLPVDANCAEGFVSGWHSWKRLSRHWISHAELGSSMVRVRPSSTARLRFTYAEFCARCDRWGAGLRS